MMLSPQSLFSDRRLPPAARCLISYLCRPERLHTSNFARLAAEFAAFNGLTPSWGVPGATPTTGGKPIAPKTSLLKGPRPEEANGLEKQHAGIRIRI